MDGAHRAHEEAQQAPRGPPGRVGDPRRWCLRGAGKAAQLAGAQ